MNGPRYVILLFQNYTRFQVSLGVDTDDTDVWAS